MADLSEAEVYGAVGEAGFERLIRSFYRRISTDDLLAPLYPADDLAGAERRLRDFLIYRFGGPSRYLESRGHPRLRMRHGSFAIDVARRDRWVGLMEQALSEACLPDEAAATLRNFFATTATFLINVGGSERCTESTRCADCLPAHRLCGG